MKKILVIVMCSFLFSHYIFAQKNERIPSKGFAVLEKGGKFQDYQFTRHSLGENDVLIEIKYASICHSDVHQVNDDWRPGNFPMVPGHEMVGVVTKVGSKVTKFKIGDYAGVGTMVNSSDTTQAYKEENGGIWNPMKTVWTYNANDPFHNNEPTQGGYANNIIVNENFSIKVPKNADLQKIAPLFCAGITVYSPIQFSKVSKGQKVAVAGFGGLGDMAVKFLQAIGADITVIDVNDEKRALAEKMGLKYLDGKNPQEVQAHNNQFDFVLSTVPTSYDPYLYLDLLKVRGEMAVVGQPAVTDNAAVQMLSLPFHANKLMYGSVIGTLEMEQRMVDWCEENNVYPDVKIIPANAESITEVYQLLRNHEGVFRYVIDMTTLK